MWNEPWLRNNDTSRCVTNNNMIGSPKLRIIDLIDNEKKGWNTDMIEEIFKPEDQY
uniref:Uncharacterized protein n=1 Tax=Cajanus cajan TaxID=3821 RepID=A0A151TIE5_CAJCA|nr:hypothetical protein KK1_013113 [Cajanus cajan]